MAKPQTHFTKLGVSDSVVYQKKTKKVVFQKKIKVKINFKKFNLPLVSRTSDTQNVIHFFQFFKNVGIKMKRN